MNALTEFFAKLFATFRINNPVLAGVIISILGGLTVAFTSGWFNLPTWAQEVGTYLSLFLTSVTSGGQITPTSANTKS